MHLSEQARQTPDKAAVIGPNSEVLSYRALDQRSLQLAQLLHAHGLNQGDHVALLIDNCPDYFPAAFAAQRRGLYLTPVNWHLTDSEAAYIVGDCGAGVIFTCRSLASQAQRICELLPAPPIIVVVDDGAGSELAAEALPNEVEGIYFFYSSGTTGRPKGIRPHHTFRPFGYGLGIDRLLRDRFGFDDTVVYLSPAPLYHSAPLGWSMATLRNGGTVVLLAAFDAAECLAAVARHRVTHVQLVPTMFVRLLKLPPPDREQHDLSSLRLVVHGAAPCPAEVKEQVISWLGPIVLEMYAGSEASGITTITSQEWLNHRGSVGRPLMGAAHILDDESNELRTGEIGTIYFSGGWTFGYHGDPGKTASLTSKQGWSTLGDLGHLDDDGYLYLADRRTDLIISGGVNIYPREIEDVLIMHPHVIDIAAIGITDSELGQRVRGVVQTSLPSSSWDQLREELLTLCQGRLARFKVPREWRFVTELPRTEAGKLRRHAIAKD